MRLDYLDFLRGIAIITVVMGHCFQYNIYGDNATTCFNFIYSFHMGFFFFISGCTASLKMERNTWDNAFLFLKKKTLQLIIPFVIWGGVISVLLNGADMRELPERLLLILQYPDRGAWFLIHLYIIQILYFICCTIHNSCNNKYMFYISALLVSGIVCILLKNYGVLYRWIKPEYVALFFIGHIAQRINWTKLFFYINPIILSCLIGFTIIAPKFDFTESGMTIKLLCSIFFSLFMYLLVRTEYDNIPARVTRRVNFLGKNTLEIYLTHYYFVILCVTPWINSEIIKPIPLFTIVLFLSVIICFLVVVMADCLKFIPWLSLILYGKSNSQMKKII